MSVFLRIGRTISESEKQKLMDKYAQVWTFQGVAWYAFD
jgi:hypothetical protein